MADPAVYCADSSLNAGEHLAGSAAEAARWLVIEHEGPWGPKGLDDSDVPHEVLAHVHALAALVPDVRVQLARKPSGGSGGCKLWLADTRPGQEALWELSLAQLSDVATLDLAGMFAGRMPAGAQRSNELLFLVCVHGKRDRCCAQRGMPVYTQIEGLLPERTWMTTHLGGHRFAATLVVLPHGICYGRVPEQKAREIVAAHAEGKFGDLSLVRGRSSYASNVQAGEVWLRSQLGEHDLGAFTYVDSEQAAGGERLRFRHASGAEHHVLVRREKLLPIMSSCGAPEKPGSHYAASAG
jgi:hypothetical protein